VNEAEMRVQRAYGPGNHECLRALTRAQDPDNLFRLSQTPRRVTGDSVLDPGQRVLQSRRVR
jgi:hypothetical protein